MNEKLMLQCIFVAFLYFYYLTIIKNKIYSFAIAGYHQIECKLLAEFNHNKMLIKIHNKYLNTSAIINSFEDKWNLQELL